MRKVSDKRFRGNQYTHLVFNFFFSRKSCLYEMRWKNTVERGRPEMTIWRIVCRITKATNTHTQNTYCVLLFHCSNGCTNAPQCYIIHTLPVLCFVCNARIGTYGLVDFRHIFWRTLHTITWWVSTASTVTQTPVSFQPGWCNVTPRLASFFCGVSLFDLPVLRYRRTLRKKQDQEGVLVFRGQTVCSSNARSRFWILLWPSCLFCR
jgi:hypothetical protein